VHSGLPGAREKLGHGDVGHRQDQDRPGVGQTFTGEVTLENINAPESYTISGEGKGGIAGFAKGGADVKLVEDGAETVLTYDVKAQVGGKLAQLGSRLIDSTSKKLAGQFFTRFNEVVSAKAAGA
jgi:carbon monoxide dehydrogenase subunit G